MVRGILFKANTDSHPNILWPVLSAIDVQRFSWYNITSQSESYNSTRSRDFASAYYTGEDFCKLVQDEHYIIFLKLQAYQDECSFQDLHSYNEFCENACSILVLVCDCDFVEIYTKDEVLAKILFDAAIAAQYKNVEYITDLNDTRTKLDVL